MGDVVLVKRGTVEEIRIFMNENGLTLSEVTILNEGTTNHVVLFYMGTEL